MSKNLDGIVARIKDERKNELPNVDSCIDRLVKLQDALYRAQTEVDRMAERYPQLAEVKRDNSFESAFSTVKTALYDMHRAQTRLQRSGINIAVAGEARQGKSQILQVLTGLGDEQIPTGAHGFCTAARSIVRNSDFQKAEVFFMAEHDFLEKRILYAYKPVGSADGALGLSPAPKSVQAFLDSEIPPLPSGKGTKDSDEKRLWNNLNLMRRQLRENRGLLDLLGASPISVEMSELRHYLTKDKGDTFYYVVDHVAVDTPFGADIPKGVTVFDLPGLRDPEPGIKETMVKSITDEADLILLIRRPDSMGDDWGDNDDEITKLINHVYRDMNVEPNEWVQLVLNKVVPDPERDKDNPIASNEENVKEMEQTAKEKEGLDPCVCNCRDASDVQQMIDVNIDRLVRKARRIDSLLIEKANQSLNAAIGETRALYNALASNEVVAQDLGPKFFKTHWEEFEKMLRLPFRNQANPPKGDKIENDPLYPFSGLAKKVLEDHFKKARAKFRSIYEKNENAVEFPPDLPVFSRKRIENLMGGRDSDEVVGKAVRNQREAVLTFVRSELTKCCDDLMDQYFKKVVEIGFNGNPALKLFGSSGKEEVSRDRIESFLAAVRKSGRYPTIESAAECLRTFNLSFEDTILPGIYSTTALSDFDPDKSYEGDEKSSGNDESDEEREEDLRPIEMVKRHIKTKIAVGAADKRATYLFNWLKMKSNDIISFMASGPSDSAFSSIARYVASAMKANYDAFAFRFIYGDDCDSEWESLTRANQAVFWKDEYEAASELSTLAKEWRKALSALADALAKAN